MRGSEKALSNYSFHYKFLAILLLVGLGQQLFRALTYQPNMIEHPIVKCIHTSDSAHIGREMMVHQRENKQPLESQPVRLQLFSWDLSSLSNDESKRTLESKFVIETLEREINRAVKITKIDLLDTRENSFPDDQKSLVINIQAVPKSMMPALEKVLIKREGCWVYTPLWQSPSWSVALSVILGDKLSLLYRAIFGESPPQDHGLWTALIGPISHLEVKAERWALPSKPGRWPQRMIYPQTAALAVTMGTLPYRRQVINIKLSDTTQKHQAGALALQSLNRSPLVQRFHSPWLMVGDWRANPPNSKSHPEVAYRFQRFSLNPLKAYSALFSGDEDPRIWGRWKASSEGVPSMIDLAYSSNGELKPRYKSPRHIQWLGEGEQRAILSFDWLLRGLSLEK